MKLMISTASYCILLPQKVAMESSRSRVEQSIYDSKRIAVWDSVHVLLAVVTFTMLEHVKRTSKVNRNLNNVLIVH